jgi:hypothetical protein
MANPQELEWFDEYAQLVVGSQGNKMKQIVNSYMINRYLNEARYTSFRLVGVLQEALDVYNSSRAVAVSNALHDVSCCGESATRT